MKRFILIVAFAIFATSGRLDATGYHGPDSYLDRGGANVLASPEFYWDLEVKRIAREFPAPEKLVPVRRGEEPDWSRRGAAKEATTEADTADFAAALREGRIKPPDAALAIEQHAEVRALLSEMAAESSATLPEEFESEFADYHRAAFAYQRGEAHWEEARQAWTTLLARPAGERHYRTVWATFMLGKLALKKRDPEASALFQRTRALASDGFADSLGLAAESYGWEARSEWKQGRPEKAAPLYLTQLALGDEGAVVSLKALIPDRAPIFGMLNYGPEEEERSAWTEEQKSAQAEKERVALQAAARDPLLRRLVTAHILATSTAPNYWGEDTGVAAARSRHWLAEIKAAKLSALPDAEYLGWAAYSCGEYKEAESWLKLSEGESAAALWLRAKLQLRAGKTADAAQGMAAAWKGVRDSATYTEWKAVVAEEKEDTSWMRDGPSWSFAQSASGDLAALRLTRADFVQALDTFHKGQLPFDAAFVAERVLSVAELQKYVEAAPPEEENGELGYILGRRLVREDRCEAAAKYLRAPYDKIVAIYAKALRDGADATLPKPERAAAFFRAAWIARHDGMELMGTEVAPDGFITDGAFPIEDVAQARLSGKYRKVSWEDGEEKVAMIAIPLRPAKEEMQRLRTNKVTPEVRFHYRLIAGALAMKAAELLPDQSEELADVINTAGKWVKDRDEKIANRYFNALTRRAAQTEIGRAAGARRWFVDATGPWSEREGAADEAMHRELGSEP